MNGLCNLHEELQCTFDGTYKITGLRDNECIFIMEFRKQVPETEWGYLYSAATWGTTYTYVSDITINVANNIVSFSLTNDAKCAKASISASACICEFRRLANIA